MITLTKALSLQHRLSPFVDELALYDRSRAFGVAVDLSHIPVKQVSMSSAPAYGKSSVC